ncbi:hypothetical protein [Nocardia seriolae]|uniref:hypothetical protein n=1 Tax=Nocardia seriolae TaxID=37332 RepID=UPI00051A2699|nr:hypothetical protein [Nocardia seriolae]MTJ62482.1 hypothetical protein [Nocardia seriolae]MTJ75508.1 hypothetical protein [Nocardia seriolae]MTJ87383.1 hypothetical protein [Nocardia seriolae]MTK31375.1 hypothetical protein [Nocardia seriolae]MTK40432.1 hypothetical protein [Nocardia seriolae]
MSADHKKKNPYAAQERRHRVEIAGALRDYGLTYAQIARKLGISLYQVEQALGEAATLRAQGLSKAEVAAEIGVPYGSVGRVLRTPHRKLLTARQNQAMDGITDMFGMQIDVLAWFLDTDLSTAYHIANILTARGDLYPLATVQPGRAWAVVKRDKAAPRLGWRPPEWHPPIALAGHYRAVTQARIMLVGSDPERWVSERHLRHHAEELAAAVWEPRPALSSGREPRAGRPHVHDGWVLRRINGELQWWAVEVELTRKDPADMDTALQGTMRATQTMVPFRQVGELVGLLYLCRTAHVLDGVSAAADRLPPEIDAIDIEFETRDFDDDWTTFLARRAERKAAGKSKRPNRLHISKEAS